MSTLTLENNQLIFASKYDPGLVNDIKMQIPYSERKWDNTRKVWIVDPKHGKLLAQFCNKYFGEMVFIPQLVNSHPMVETKILEVHYIGTTKDRGNGERTAFGYMAGEWAVIFPEDVLKVWFGAMDTRPGEAGTLYQVLGITNTVSPEEIKRAYRRLARIWHPDVSKDPDAEEQFKAINHAYEILNDPVKRTKYQAGLALQASINKPANSVLQNSYRAPLKCGFILAEGLSTIGRFVVTKIIDWQDIFNPAGKQLVTSWPMGAKEPLESWI